MIILAIACILAFIFFRVYKLVLYEEYKEEYSYGLKEVKSGTYAIYSTVTTTEPNYEMVETLYNTN